MTIMEFKQIWFQIDAALQWVVFLLSIQVGISLVRLLLFRK
jgi:hypothetical protein